MHDLFSASEIAVLLLCMHRCGSAPDSVVSALARRALELDAAAFTPKEAVYVLAILGDLHIPGHFHLHKWSHSLLPVVRGKLAPLLTTPRLVLAVANNFSQYSVQGPITEELGDAVEAALPSMSLLDCWRLLRSMRRWSFGPVGVLPAVCDRICALVQQKDAPAHHLVQCFLYHASLNYPEWLENYLALSGSVSLLVSRGRVPPPTVAVLCRGLAGIRKPLPAVDLYTQLANTLLESNHIVVSAAALSDALHFVAKFSIPLSEVVEERLRKHAIRNLSRLECYGVVGAIKSLNVEKMSLPEQQQLVTSLSEVATALPLHDYLLALEGASRVRVDPISLNKLTSLLHDFNTQKALFPDDICRVVRALLKMEIRDRIILPDLLRLAAKRIGDADCGTLTRVAITLTESGLFLPPYFSKLTLRLCEMHREPLANLLPPFAALAEEYAIHLYRGSLFGKLWKHLRKRILEEAHTFTLEMVLLAANAFAILNPTDTAVFGVLVQRFCGCYESSTSSPHDFETRLGEMTHSAIVPMLCGLSRSVNASREPLLHMMLLGVCNAIPNLYPIDVFTALPCVLSLMAKTLEAKIATESTQPSPPIGADSFMLDPSWIGLLHSTFDRLSNAATEMAKEDASLDPTARKSLSVPLGLFVSILMQMSAARVVALPLVVVCINALVKSRKLLSAHQLVLAVTALATLEQGVEVLQPFTEQLALMREHLEEHEAVAIKRVLDHHGLLDSPLAALLDQQICEIQKHNKKPSVPPAKLQEQQEPTQTPVEGPSCDALFDSLMS